jgi:hypothetical protein
MLHDLMNSRFRPLRFSEADAATRRAGLGSASEAAAGGQDTPASFPRRTIEQKKTFRREGPHPTLHPLCEMRPPPE